MVIDAPKADVIGDQKSEVESTSNIPPKILASVFEDLVVIPLKDRQDKKCVENVLLGVVQDAHHPCIGTVN